MPCIRAKVIKMERIRTEMGTVIRYDEYRNLTATLVDGEEVIIPHDELHKDPSNYDLRRHLGRELELVDTGRTDFEGRRIFSHKTVEESDFEWLRYNFETKKQNTYWAHYRGLTNNGTLAFYKIGDTSINGAIALKDFSLNHMSSYNDCVMPASIQVVITEIHDGKIQLSSIPGFLGFEETINMLKLHPGSAPLGKATRQLGDSPKTIVMLTPNVATLIDGGFEGADVKVLIANINYEKRKIKSRLDSVVEMPGSRKIDYNQYIRKNRLPDFLLLDDYKNEQGYFKRRGSSSVQNSGSASKITESVSRSEDNPEKNPLAYFDDFLRSIAS